MYSNSKNKRFNKKVVYTVVVAVVLFAMFLSVVRISYNQALEDGFENLHMQTKEIKEDIELQVFSDMENLQTMANFAAKLYSDGEDFDILINSFRAIGLIENIGILMPDNTFITKMGKIKLPEDVSFEQEAKNEKFVSGVVNDFTADKHKIVRCSVPIKYESQTVAILYGMTGLETIEKHIQKNVSVDTAQVFIVERGKGNFIVNTISDTVDNISILETREFIDGYSYEELSKMVSAGMNGYTAFVSRIMVGETFYLHHSPLNIGDWHIMLAEPEEIVFSEARTTGRIMAIIFSAIVLVMSLYLLLFFKDERKEGRVNRCASKIRKLLLEINHQSESINEALDDIARFGAARSSMFVDTDGDCYYSIINRDDGKIPDGEDREYFISRLINYALKITKNRGTSISVILISADSKLAVEDQELYAFMQRHSMKNILFSGVVNKNEHISILVTVNPNLNTGIKVLLEDISVCFSMAIFNKKYLNETETVAATDPLTGLSNRMAYKKDLEKINKQKPAMFACIYIDVNELHVINNKFGHATGDSMLLFVTGVLREAFPNGNIYRIGGDEFLIFTEGIEKETVEKNIQFINRKVEEMDYHISIGIDYSEKNTDTEAMVSQAEKRMYREKTRYYQMKERNLLVSGAKQTIEHIVTGNKEFDSLLEVVSKRYHGIYNVSLTTGKAHKILVPSYLSNFSEDNDSFKTAYEYYVAELVHPDYQRAVLGFLNYDAIRVQLTEGTIPSIGYSKVNGERVVLSVYSIDKDNPENTLWVFESTGYGE